jgi:hypothetical protein
MLYVVVDHGEKRITFSEEHVRARGKVFAQCWTGQDDYDLRLKGVAWGGEPSNTIVFRVYTDLGHLERPVLLRICRDAVAARRSPRSRPGGGAVSGKEAQVTTPSTGYNHELKAQCLLMRH